MKRILMASDLSERSLRALRRAVSLARQFGSELVVLHVVDDDQPRTLVTDERLGAEAALRDDLARSGAGSRAAPPAVSVLAGDPFRVIVDEAERLDAELIVMGTHRKRLLGDIFTGTTIERVMRLGNRPVLMVNRDEDAPYSRALAAIDLSGNSAHALREAHRLGLLDPERDAAVHGFLPLGEGLMYYAGVDRDKVDEHVTASTLQARAAITGFLRENGFGPMTSLLLIEKGTPFEAIEIGVQQVRPDLLVIGTRGHGGMKRVLIGSVADAVLRRVECDILAVPLPAGTPT